MRSLRELCDQGSLAVYFDATPLLDTNWTGIPVVAAHLAREFIADLGSGVCFFSGGYEVHGHAVAEALEAGGGKRLADQFHADLARRPLNFASETMRVGFYPSVKKYISIFDYEYSLVHDLSTLLTPQFHTVENIRHHMNGAAAEISSNTITFCVSRATQEDVQNYFGVTPDRLHVAYNGVSWPPDFDKEFDAYVGAADVEPFVTILGTREPRKNIRLVYEALERYPELLEQYRFVFVGKVGWGEGQSPVPKSLEPYVERGRILFTGYATEFEKYKVLRAAQFSIYPSLFEGFGLPVAESMSVGTPCICAASSSLVEVGGSAAIYFDALSRDSLRQAITQLQSEGSDGLRARGERSIAQANRFNWSNMYREIQSAMAQSLPGTKAASARTTGA